MDRGFGCRGARSSSETCRYRCSWWNVGDGRDCVRPDDDWRGDFLNGEAPICARGQDRGRGGDVGAAERGSGCLLVDLLELVRPDVGSDNASSTISRVAHLRIVSEADRREPGFARHLSAEVMVGSDQGLCDRFPPSAEDLGVLGAAIDLAPMFCDGDPVLFEGEHDGVGAGVGVVEGGAGGNGDDHGDCPCFRRGVKFDDGR